MKKLSILVLCLFVALFALCSCDLSSIPFLGIHTVEPEDNANKNTIPEECTVSFVTNAGYEIDPVTVKYNTGIKAPTEPSKKGATFAGWYFGDVKWDFTYDKVVEDMTLNAKWNLVSYSISYDLGGGSYDGAMPESYTVESQTLTLGTPVRENYEFLGWTINGKEATEIKMGSTGNKEIKANWFGLEATVLAVKDGAKGIVCFIHDDARLDTMAIMDELLEKHGLVGDVGFLLNKVYNGYTVDKTAVSNYRVYLDNGRWKIVNHSATHNWWGTEIMNEFGITLPVDDTALMEYELVTSQAKMRELFPGQRVLTFAYPGFSSVSNKYTDNSKAQLQTYIYTAKARRLIETHHIGARFYNGGTTTIGGNVDWNWLNAAFLSPSMIDKQLKTTLENTVKYGYLNLLSLHALTRDPAQPEKDSGYSLLDTYMDKAMAMVDEYVEKGDIWNTHFEDAILYLREAETATATVKKDGNKIILTLTDEMDDEIYDAPLTVRITNFGDAEIYKVVNNGKTSYVNPKIVDGVKVLDINLVPNGEEVVITPASAN